MCRDSAYDVVKFHQVFYRLSKLTRTDRRQTWFLSAAIVDFSLRYSCDSLRPAWISYRSEVPTYPSFALKKHRSFLCCNASSSGLASIPLNEFKCSVWLSWLTVFVRVRLLNSVKFKGGKFLKKLRRSANARNVSFRISLRWPIHIINPVDKTKL